MLDPLIWPAGLTNFTPHTVLLTPAVVIKLISKFRIFQNLSKSHSGSNQFYPTYSPSYTRCIYKIDLKNLSKICLIDLEHSVSKQAFALHFIYFKAAV